MFDHAVYFSFYNGAIVESAHWRAHECWIVEILENLKKKCKL